MKQSSNIYLDEALFSQWLLKRKSELVEIVLHSIYARKKNLSGKQYSFYQGT